MLHQRHVRLVVHDPREHIVSRNGHREALALPERSSGFVGASSLREQHGRQRVDEREMTAIADGVKCRGRLGQVLAHDSGIANLLVAERELVVRKADGARVVRELGMLERPRVQRDRSRLFAAGKRDAAVQPPRVWRAAHRKSARSACPGDGPGPTRPGSDRPEEARLRPGLRERSAHRRGSASRS